LAGDFHTAISPNIFSACHIVELIGILRIADDLPELALVNALPWLCHQELSSLFVGLSCCVFDGAELGIMNFEPPGLEPEFVAVRWPALEPPVPFWETAFMRGMDHSCNKKSPCENKG